MVCLPGIRGDARIFTPLTALHPAVSWVLLDLPPGGPALAAARLRSVLPAGRFHLLTGSFGGLVARFLPAPRIASIACIGTLPSKAFLQPRMIRQAQLLMTLPDRLLGPLYERHARRSLTAAGLPLAPVAQLLDRPIDPPVLRGRLRSVLAGHHGRVPALPVAWIHGTDDPQITWSRADLQRAVPHAQVFEVPGGHFPHATHPGDLWTSLHHGWWSQIPSARPTTDPPE